MKKLIQLYLLLILALPCLAMNSDAIAVSGIKSAYRKGEPIKITIINKTNQDKYISLGLSTFDNEESEWFEQVSDLSNYNCNPREKLGIIYRLLKANDMAIVEWYPKKANNKHCFNWQANNGKYRIEVRVAEDNNSKPANFLSSSFTIN